MKLFAPLHPCKETAHHPNAEKTSAPRCHVVCMRCTDTIESNIKPLSQLPRTPIVRSLIVEIASSPNPLCSKIDANALMNWPSPSCMGPEGAHVDKRIAKRIDPNASQKHDLMPSWGWRLWCTEIHNYFSNCLSILHPPRKLIQVFQVPPPAPLN